MGFEIVGSLIVVLLPRRCDRTRTIRRPTDCSTPPTRRCSQDPRACIRMLRLRRRGRGDQEGAGFSWRVGAGDSGHRSVPRHHEVNRLGCGRMHRRSKVSAGLPSMNHGRGCAQRVGVRLRRCPGAAQMRGSLPLAAVEAAPSELARTCPRALPRASDASLGDGRDRKRRCSSCAEHGHGSALEPKGSSKTRA